MSRKKTIAFTIHSLVPGGAERVVSSLANQLVTENFNVKIITLVKCGSFYELHPDIKLLSCDSSHSENQTIISSAKNHIKILKTISKFIKEENIDLLIGFTTAVNVLTVISAKLNRIPVIISERNNASVNPPNKFRKILRDIFYKYSNYLVVQTTANANYYSEIISLKKIIIIKNPISSILASKRTKKTEMSNNKTIITVGRLDSNKAQDLLIRAFSNIYDGSDWNLQIIGDGNKKDEYKTLTEKLNISHKVTFTGNVPNVYDYYNNASIFVFTSKSEGFPNALAEALYFGLSSISTNCPYGPSDLIDHNINGILIEVDDQKKLEAELSKLMTDEKLRLNLSEAAIKKSEELRIELITNEWMNYINKLLK